jgi:hypothetical protein
MAVDYTPSKWVTGIVVTDATYCNIPWSALGDAAQNETDIRNILRGLADTIKAHYDDPTDGGTYPTDEVPTKFTASESTRYNDSSSEFEEKHGWTFDLTCTSTHN